MTEQATPPGRDVTIGAGGPPPEEDVADGTHPLILAEIGEWRQVEAKPGSPYFGKPAQWFRDWIFKVNDGGPFSGRRVTGSCSQASGPKSKQFGFIVALNGGQEPNAGDKFDVDELVGRVALGKVYHDDGGYPKVDTLIAMPVQQLQQQFAQATQPPAPDSPLRELVGNVGVKPADDLPF